MDILKILNVVGNVVNTTAVVANIAESVAESKQNKDLIRKAEAGDVELQLQLASAFEEGKGDVRKSYSEAVKWYRMAAERGNAVAQFKLGYFSTLGVGMPLSYEEAAKWYRKAAEQGHSEAQFKLATLYEAGNGVKKSMSAAAKWYELSAKQGNVVGQFNIGLFYTYGTGVKQSYEKAVKWYRLAAEQGNPDAQTSLGWCYFNGKGVEKSLSEAAKLWYFAAVQGYSIAQYNLGCCYENGESVEKSVSEAIKWYRKAAKRGNEDAIAALERLGLNSDEHYENDNSTSSSRQSNTEPSVSRNFKSYFLTTGRIGRLEYLLTQFVFWGGSVLSFLLGIFCFVVIIPLFWILMAQGAKRCHDLGKSGWYQFVPIYFLWMFFVPGKKA